MSKASGHSFEVRLGNFKGDVLDMFFTQRAVGAWNMSSVLVVEANMVVAFQRLWHNE